MDAPFTWFGGKGFISGYIKEIIPPHKTYIEVFGGSAKVLFAKTPSEKEIYNDIDFGLCNFFRTIQDKALLEPFLNKIKLYPFSSLEFKYARDNWNKQESNLDKAILWYIKQRQSFGGKGKSFGSSIDSLGGSQTISRSLNDWHRSIIEMHKFSDRLQNVTIENDTYNVILDKYDDEKSLFYLDPPYVLDVRKGKHYIEEMTSEEHINFINKIMNMKSMIILSGYENEIYNKLTKNGWYTKTIDVVSCAVGHTAYNYNETLKDFKRKEIIWINPQAINKKSMV